MHFGPAAMVLAMGRKVHFCANFFSVVFFCLTPFPQGYFGLIGVIIVMKEFVSLTTLAMEIGKRHFFSYHSNGCSELKMLL